MERVAALYANQPTLAYCGRLVASAVVGALKDLKKGGRERPVMVEIGAGTGSATGEVLAAIEAAGLAVAYHYTDVSPGFVRHGKATFAGPDRHFEVLDIEKPPSAQGFARRQRRHRRRGQRPPRHARDRPDTGARGRAAPPRRASRPRRADGARRFRDRHLRSSRRLVARHRSRSAPRARPAPGRAVLAGGVPTGRPGGRWWPSAYRASTILRIFRTASSSPPSLVTHSAAARCRSRRPCRAAGGQERAPPAALSTGDVASAWCAGRSLARSSFPREQIEEDRPLPRLGRQFPRGAADRRGPRRAPRHRAALDRSLQLRDARGPARPHPRAVSPRRGAGGRRPSLRLQRR